MWQAEYPDKNHYFIVDSAWPDINWDKVHNYTYESFEDSEETKKFES